MITSTVSNRPATWKSISLPSPGSRQTRVRIPIYEETAFRTTHRDDPVTGTRWAVATISEWWVNPDPRPPIGETTARLSWSAWMREGTPNDPVTQELVESQGDGWFEATTEQIAARSRLMKQTRREQFRRLNDAKLQRLHLLRCGSCGELSDLQAQGWRIRLEEDGSTTTVCLSCV